MIDATLEIHIDGLSLYSVYGHACLGLRHPKTHGEGRIICLKAIESIGAYLVDCNAITEEIRFLHERNLTQWARDYHDLVAMQFGGG